MADLSLAGIRRLIYKAGAERVSKEAVETMREIVEDIVVKIAKVAVELAQHAKRRTIMKEDVKKAAELILKL
ncbi:MAG: histone family protein [Candidatus Njordarchaeales archaeon]